MHISMGTSYTIPTPLVNNAERINSQPPRVFICTFILRNNPLDLSYLSYLLHLQNLCFFFCLVGVLEKNRLPRLVQSLCHVICRQMETSQILDSEFDIISPWMLLYEIIIKYVYNKSVLNYKGSLKEHSLNPIDFPLWLLLFPSGPPKTVDHLHTPAIYILSPPQIEKVNLVSKV